MTKEKFKEELLSSDREDKEMLVSFLDKGLYRAIEGILSKWSDLSKNDFLFKEIITLDDVFRHNESLKKLNSDRLLYTKFMSFYILNEN
jgi:hypothetical protein